MTTQTSSAVEPTAGPKSERRLARSLGYPPTWHVVRVVPHPADSSSAAAENAMAAAAAAAVAVAAAARSGSFQDRIYAGDPRKNADAYFNHVAAMEAALRWNEEDSTPYDDGGGQLLPRKAKYEKNERVEVFFEDAWYPATILRVKVGPGDVKYSVLYTEEDTHQHGVSEADIRPAPPKKRKAKPKKAKLKKNTDESASAAEATATKSTTVMMTASAGTKRKAPDQADSGGEDGTAAAAEAKHHPEHLRNAAELGLPEGWACDFRKNYKLVIRSPEGKRFTSKRAAFEHAGVEMPATTPSGGPAGKIVSSVMKRGGGAKKQGGLAAKEKGEAGHHSATGHKSKAKSKKNPPAKDTAIDEGDPPWRTSGHDHLGKRVRYSNSAGTLQLGTVTGWIASTDVDSMGEPAFLSERTGKPAPLFHVTFDRPAVWGQGGPAWLTSQDFEEYELEGLFVDEEEEEGDNGVGGSSSSEDDGEGESDLGVCNSSEDDVPLSTIAKKKGLTGRGGLKGRKEKHQNNLL